jgi:hypothetical protein
MTGNYDNPGDNVYLVPNDIVNSGTIGNADIPMSSGTARKLIFRATTPAGATATLTVYKNGAATALTCTIAASGTGCQDLVNSVTFADGDTLALRYDETGSPSIRVKLSILYQAP